MSEKITCKECGKEFESDAPWEVGFCPTCIDEEVMASLSQGGRPEGGWPRGSDMDRL